MSAEPNKDAIDFSSVRVFWVIHCYTPIKHVLSRLCNKNAMSGCDPDSVYVNMFYYKDRIILVFNPTADIHVITFDTDEFKEYELESPYDFYFCQIPIKNLHSINPGKKETPVTFAIFPDDPHNFNVIIGDASSSTFPLITSSIIPEYSIPYNPSKADGSCKICCKELSDMSKEGKGNNFTEVIFSAYTNALEIQAERLNDPTSSSYIKGNLSTSDVPLFSFKVPKNVIGSIDKFKSACTDGIISFYFYNKLEIDGVVYDEAIEIVARVGPFGKIHSYIFDSH